MVAAMAMAAAPKSSAQVAEWNVTGHGLPFDVSLPASNSDVNLASVPALTRGGGLLGSSAANSFSSTNWNIFPVMNVSSNYLTFTVTPASGFQLNLTSLRFIMCGSNTAPEQDAWGYSTDGGSTWTIQPTFFMTLTYTTNTWDFADFSSSSAVEFRFWEWGSVAINGGPSSKAGTARIAQDLSNNSNPSLVLNGTVTTIPEPSTLILIGFSIAGILAFSRRRFTRG